MQDNIQYKENVLKPEDFIRLRTTVGFFETPIEQTKKALDNGLYNIVAICNDMVVGMGRLVGDGMMYWYIQDVAVLPEYQGQGIGKTIVKKLMDYAEKNSIPGTRTTIGLSAAKGKESFYEILGFERRPSDYAGAGMMKRFMVPGRE